MPRSKCSKCVDPGRCCSGFVLTYPGNGHYVGKWKTKAWVEKKLKEMDLPYYPIRRGRDGIWTYGCHWLNEKGRCSHYRKRPKTCRNFKPGSDALCTMHSGSNEIEKRLDALDRAVLTLAKEMVKVEPSTKFLLSVGGRMVEI